MLNIENFKGEIDYWDRELSLHGDYPEDIKDRVIPERMKNIFPSCLFPLMKEVKNRLPRILDVGSGPVSMLNYGEEKKLIHLTTADPLADEYYKLLLKYNYCLKYPAFCLPGEKLSTGLKENHFDITWCHNALDHSQSPGEVVKEMIKVTRYGGYIVIHTWENEGTFEGFHGLHKHNLFFNNEEGLCLQTLDGDFGKLSPPIPLIQNLPVSVSDIKIINKNGRNWIELTLRKYCIQFHSKRTDQNKNFFDALINSWFPIYSNPNFPLWGLYALTTNERGYYIKDLVSKYTDIKGKKYLDIGTAYGGSCIAFSKECKFVAGFDINEDFLRLAKANFSDNNLSPENLHCIDITQKTALEPFKNSFDLITCNDVIEHVENVKQAIENISELLSPCGIVYFEIPNKEYPGFVIKDGHYGLFGITLLSRNDAEDYYKEFFKEDYTVGEYYFIDEYCSLFPDSEFELIYCNDKETVNTEQAEKDIQFLKDNKKQLLSSVPEKFKGKLKYRLDKYLKNIEVENCYPFWKIILRKKEAV